jgi:hypothetical protein
LRGVKIAQANLRLRQRGQADAARDRLFGGPQIFVQRIDRIFVITKIQQAPT